MKYLNKFKYKNEYDTYSRKEKSLLKRRVSLVGKKVDYYDQNEPFYIEAIDDVSFDIYSCLGDRGQYSFDLKNWIKYEDNNYNRNINISPGKRVYLKGFNKKPKFTIEGRYNIGGSFSYVYSDIAAYSSNGHFVDELGLISAENLIINSQYLDNTFKGCKNLVNGPKIAFWPHDSTWSVTKLDHTFEGCTSLVESPTLCGEIEDARYTFTGCSNLSKVTFLSTADVFTSSFTDWLNGVSETGLLTLNWNISQKLFDTILPTVPSKWEIRWYDSDADKYFVKFNIDDVQYIADHDMTWEQWINSTYNTAGLTVVNNNITNGESNLLLDSASVLKTDIVKRVAGTDYTFVTSDEIIES